MAASSGTFLGLPGSNDMLVAALLLSAAGCILELSIELRAGFPPPEEPATQLAGWLTPVLLLVSAWLRLRNHRLGRGMAVAAALIGIACIAWQEGRGGPWESPWVRMNVAVYPGDPVVFPALAPLRIFSAASLIFSAMLAGCADRIGAALTVATGAWFGVSAIPYRHPGRTDSIESELAILHVVKRGLTIQEVSLGVSRDGKFGISQTGRRLFQYRFASRGAWGTLPLDLRQQAKELAREAGRARNPLPGPLRAWNAEGWYILGAHVLGAYTTENGRTPPQEAVELFQSIAQVEKRPTQEWPLHDVCLGFCYDAPAAFGYAYRHRTCSTEADGATRCR